MADTSDVEAVISFGSGSGLTMKILMGSQSVEETQLLMDHLGKVEIDIGDGLTLLHQAASNNRADLVKYLCSKGHSTEVLIIISCLNLKGCPLLFSGLYLFRGKRLPGKLLLIRLVGKMPPTQL